MLALPPLQLALAALLHLIITTSAVSTTTSHPDHQLLNVTQALFGTSRSSEYYHEELVNVTESDDQGEWKLKLVHRDCLSLNKAAVFLNHSHRFHARMQRDVKRVASLLLRISGGGFHYDEAADGVNDFGSDIVSGMDQGSGEYFVRIGVGSPPRSQYMVIDSGSDIVWVQCQPCNQCYKQSDPVFDPAASASYGGVSCSSSVCDRIENSGCRAGRCRYEVMYGDGSYTKGTLALETLTFGPTVVQNVAIGCGHVNRGMFIGAAGLLGLGGGSMSLVGQLGGQTGGAFSYCLVSRGTNSSGSLVFGREAMPVGAAWVPLLRNPQAPTFYYIGLSGLGVGGIRVPIPEDIFQLTELGLGGVVMDTGTAVTRFPAIAYDTFRDAFTEQTANLPQVTGISIFDTCYNLSSFVTVRIPTVSFYLSSGPILTLPANNFLIPVDDTGTFCFAFASSGSDLSIIGNIQQEGIQISFDGANGYVGFGPSDC
ncbi:Protein ASPARTIC PROTEASE IN GUARD CELL 2 [Hibiscus syriacus]|uniref:Protein ASPARTIC PROTEASE IN GUARD CELL 2 n=1 Tax=Hibiscus syriacus TaxID=106335 RepID=A0A6A3B461_HIBSY|nr:protein ASPARTIC PROTEASE IN GUARD CELL 2-like [Hibiscus syriacus]KAE8711770.1 Protein ASPARTIC PROTEASE IN GUARD CELL 2 [Hibiscus syriacus]